ncbi:MAG: c-type cytochrome [Allosphingosinicella sp.]
MRPAFGLGAGLLLAGAACGAPSASVAPDGDRLYGRHCYGCHALEPGRNSPAGPTLHEIVGRPVAGERGFNYSPALRRLADRQPRWTTALLDRFLADPEGFSPGTEMGFPGLAEPAERRALIDWLGQERRSD